MCSSSAVVFGAPRAAAEEKRLGNLRQPREQLDETQSLKPRKDTLAAKRSGGAKFAEGVLVDLEAL